MAELNIVNDMYQARQFQQAKKRPAPFLLKFIQGNFAHIDIGTIWPVVLCNYAMGSTQ